ncbi:stage II sporulation protein E [Adhaeribacter arboris]|uniref:Stage II sporulation protein E n=1 Tax=Adhaeribacter arboris TaxID=2072846 RepID=A0A2T2YMX0_9BACT|nr:ATP-binding protein [Adhaeribacter arboris]PSR56864.1 stage II sporulation protein E [Adhaeribacter arboris]
MDYNQHLRFELVDRSFLNIVKRDIAKLAENYGHSETEIGKINIIVAEMASNLLKHTPSGGEILVKPLAKENQITGIEILSLDNGPGMSHPQQMLEDGVSTHGSSGEGLGAIKRLSDEFDLYSTKESGTVLLTRLYKKNYKPKISQRSKFQISAVMVAKPGETVCGDGWMKIEQNDCCCLLIVDGLGHGENAHQATKEAIAAFQNQVCASPAHGLRQIHADITRTRGGVMNLAVINPAENAFTYCGIGNIAGRLISAEGSKSIISYNGIVGHNIPNTLHDHHLPWNNSYVFVLHSDGLKSRWELARHPDLLKHDPSVIAAVLYKEGTRKTDDTLVIVGKTRS